VAQRAVAASEPAGWYRPTAYRTDRLEVTAPNVYRPICSSFFGKMSIIFLTTTPIDIKPSTCPAHGRHACAWKISPSYDAAFRRR